VKNWLESILASKPGAKSRTSDPANAEANLFTQADGRDAVIAQKPATAFNDEHCEAVVLCTPLKAYKKTFHLF
jgi:hypothetical protein